MATVRLLTGDVFDVLTDLDAEVCDACLCDPPYGLRFMGKRWDDPGSLVERRRDPRNTFDLVAGNHNPAGAGDRARTRLSEGRRFQAWAEGWALEVLRVLRPGAHLLAFGGTRTYHRLACGVEDAGFELRDGIAAWLYGQGFPKSLDVSQAIDRAAGAEREVIGVEVSPFRVDAAEERRASYNRFSAGIEPNGYRSKTITAPATSEAERWVGYGTALKPAWEPVIVGMKPPAGTFASNALEHGVSGFNIDGARVPIGEGDRESYGVNGDEPSAPGNGVTGGERRRVAYQRSDLGRWPANVALCHGPDCGETCAPGCPVGELDRQSGTSRPGARPARRAGIGFTAAAGRANAGTEGERVEFAAGGASRFFYCAKASRAERDGGLPAGEHNLHPTVKPIDLCRWLALMLLPPRRRDGAPRRLLVPFAGSGSEVIGAVLAGWEEVIAVERDPDYARDYLVPRVTAAGAAIDGQPPATIGACSKSSDQPSLFHQSSSPPMQSRNGDTSQ